MDPIVEFTWPPKTVQVPDGIKAERELERAGYKLRYGKAGWQWRFELPADDAWRQNEERSKTRNLFPVVHEPDGAMLASWRRAMEGWNESKGESSTVA